MSQRILGIYKTTIILLKEDEIDQELFQNVKIFLEKEKGCSNIEDEVPIKEKTPMLKKVFRNWDKVRIAWKTQN